MNLLSLIPVVGKLFDTVDNVTNRITDLKIVRENATTQREKDQLDAKIAELNGRKDYLIAAVGSPWGRIVLLVQLLASIPVIAIIWKILIYDQMLGWGFTPALGADIWYLIYMVWGFWFIAIVKARS